MLIAPGSGEAAVISSTNSRMIPVFTGVMTKRLQSPAGIERPFSVRLAPCLPVGPLPPVPVPFS